MSGPLRAHAVMGLLAATALVLGCSQTAPENGKDATEGAARQPSGEEIRRGGTFRVDGLEFRVPDTWVVEQPRSTSFVIRLGQFRLPGSEGDAEMTVIRAGGSTEDNLNRWYAQFGLTRGAASPEEAEERELEVAGHRAVFVDIRGTYAPGPMMLRPGQKARQPGYRMLGAIVEMPGESLFFKAVGPESTLERHKEAFLEFLRSARKVEGE